MPTHQANRRYDLEERLISFSVMMLDLVESLPDTRIGNHLAGQVLRSGTSPAPNYGEAQSAESRRDFIHKMRICLKELRETQIHLKVLRKKGLCPDADRVDATLSECTELVAIFTSSVETARKNSR
jgi:four helix bundle protein